MAEVLGAIASGITVAETLSRAFALARLIESFKDRGEKPRQLQAELIALTCVLKRVDEKVLHPSDRRDIAIPLQQCARLCEDFENLIHDCTRHSSSGRSVRDWARLNVKEEEILWIRSLIEGYKSTIGIIIGTIERRSSNMTADDAKQWCEHISETSSRLERQLSSVSQQIQAISAQQPFPSSETLAQRERLQIERQRIQDCLEICTRGSTETRELLRENLEAGAGTQLTAQPNTPSQQLDGVLESNNKNFCNLEKVFNTRLQEIEIELTTFRLRDYAAAHQEEKAYRSKAFGKVSQEAHTRYEDIKAAEGAIQVIGSSDHSIFACRINAEARAEQYLNVSDAVLLERFRQRGEPVPVPPESTDRSAPRFSSRRRLFSRLRL